MGGAHLIIDATEVNQLDLNSSKQMHELLEYVSKRINAHVLSALSHHFDPQGVSVILLLAESHCSIHTWPETKSCHIDFYHCGDADKTYERTETANSLFRQQLGGVQKFQIIKRNS